MRLVRSPNPAKKYRAIFKDGSHTDFGSRGMNDYTLLCKKDREHADERKRLYHQRHQKDLQTNDPRRAGYLSFYILWNKPTVRESVTDYKARFGDL
jgi:hypothetical protein